MDLILKGYLPPINLENEVDTWIRIDKIATHQLLQYPTSLDEDQELLKQEEPQVDCLG